ncbi:FeoA family protein [Thaumasiovibrio sp. DFM-14]|uniref:FeoA family protein n=1 Tax=Thaumasiovibrio sp. DFM-14 TaxID=3384792 RepID=UPI0039A29123
MRLTELKDNQVAHVVNMSRLPATTRKRLTVMGMLPGTEVMVVRRAPLGDPLQVRVRGVDLAIRKALAQDVEVQA